MAQALQTNQFVYNIYVGGSIGRIALTVDTTCNASVSEQLKAQLKNAIESEARYTEAKCYPDLDNDQILQLKDLILDAIDNVHKMADASTDRGEFKERVLEAAIQAANNFRDHLPEQYGIEPLTRDPELFIDDINDIALSFGDSTPVSAHWLTEVADEAIARADLSSPQDWFASLGDFTLMYVRRDPNLRNMEENTLRFNTSYASAVHVVPDEAFMRLLNFLNIPALQYINALHRYYDVDLTCDSVSPMAAEWKKLKTSMKPVNPIANPKVSPKELVELVDNSYTSANPVLYFQVNFDTLLRMHPADQLIVKEGTVGLHDFVNGAGHMVKARAPVAIPVDFNHIFMADDVLQSTYGMDINAVACETVIAEPDPQNNLSLEYHY